MLIFLALTAWVVYCGVEKGIEKYSRYIMPGLLLLIIGIAIFSLTLSYTDESGMTRTGIEGLLVYIKPDFTGLTVQRFLNIALDAMSQLFFSLSVSMGIMITYGSYVKDDVDLNKANNQIEIFDTGVAFLAGLMIIPAVYVFLGTDGMASGPSLTFISLPKVFAAMGGVGRVVGAVFFLALGFAALAAMVVVVLMSYAQLTSISADVVSMQKELKTLDAEHVALLTQYERTFDLETVKAAAAAAGMNKPSSSQINYIDLSAPDSVELCEAQNVSVLSRVFTSLGQGVFSVVEYFS